MAAPAFRWRLCPTAGRRLGALASANSEMYRSWLQPALARDTGSTFGSKAIRGRLPPLREDHRLAVLGHEVGVTRLMGVVPMPVWMRSVL